MRALSDNTGTVLPVESLDQLDSTIERFTTCHEVVEQASTGMWVAVDRAYLRTPIRENLALGILSESMQENVAAIEQHPIRFRRVHRVGRGLWIEDDCVAEPTD